MNKKERCSILVERIFDKKEKSECVLDIKMPLNLTREYVTIDFVSGKGQLDNSRVKFFAYESCKNKTLVALEVAVPICLEFIADGEAIVVDTVYVIKERVYLKFPKKSKISPYIRCSGSVVIPKGEVENLSFLTCMAVTFLSIHLVGIGEIYL